MARRNQRVVRQPEDWFPPVRSGLATSASLEIIESSVLLTVPAGEILNGHRAVCVNSDGKAYHADVSEPCASIVTGITLGAAEMDSDATIQTSGILENESWTWVDTAPIWLGVDGMLTQTVPITGYIVQLGVPVGPTKINIAPQFIALIGG